MKKVFSNLLLIFVLPFKQFKKIFKDNFLSGLILGALFSLLVNVISMQVQGVVDKQRILEAIENEIVSNLVNANNVITLNQQDIDKKIQLYSLYVFKKYSRDLWAQSSEPLQRVSQLDQKTQIAIHNYYTLSLPFSITIQDKIIRAKEKLDDYCFEYLGSEIKKDKINECNFMFYELLKLEMTTSGKYVSEDSFKLLKQFHPTKDRLNNPFLRFLMGSESTRILSGK